MLILAELHVKQGWFIDADGNKVHMSSAAHHAHNTFQHIRYQELRRLLKEEEQNGSEDKSIHHSIRYPRAMNAVNAKARQLLQCRGLYRSASVQSKLDRSPVPPRMTWIRSNFSHLRNKLRNTSYW